MANAPVARRAPTIETTGTGAFAGAIRRAATGTWARLWLVGLTGIVVNQALIVALTDGAGLQYLVSALVATAGSTTWNYLLAEAWVFRGRDAERPAMQRYAAFLGLAFASQVVRIPVLAGLVELAGMHYALANLVSLGILAAGRAAVADRVIWSPRRTTGTADAAAGLPHRYAVGGVVTIASAVRLPELEWFRVRPDAAVAGATPDITIRVGWVAPRPTRRVRFERDGDRLVYREQPGPFGANFSLRMGTPIEIVVSPLLARSPHVVYTNIVEAFLRFLLASRGHLLLHAACIADEQGRATLITAKTDTGKTSTVISLVRRHGYRFLSDDMTIITPDGAAVAYPKPMTLSFHTLRAATGGRMTVRQRLALQIQSRLHSKSGREVGRVLGQGNLPIMTMNAIVQALVPPPKYAIDSLFPCRVGGRASIRGMVVIERGDPELCQRLSLPAALRTLIENTDDAYGFPPFATFAPQVEIDGADYPALREAERAVIARMLRGVERWQLRDPARNWADTLPTLFPDVPAEPATVAVRVMAGPGTSPATTWAGAPSDGVAGSEPAPVGAMAFHQPSGSDAAPSPVEVA